MSSIFYFFKNWKQKNRSVFTGSLCNIRPCMKSSFDFQLNFSVENWILTLLITEFQINFWFSILNQKFKIDLRFDFQSHIKHWKLIYLSIFNFQLKHKNWILIIINFEVLKFNHNKWVEISRAFVHKTASVYSVRV